MPKYSVDATLVVATLVVKQPEGLAIALQAVLDQNKGEKLTICSGGDYESNWLEDGFLDVIWTIEQVSVEAAEAYVEQYLPTTIKLPEGLTVKEHWISGTYNDEQGFWESESWSRTPL